MARRQLDDHMVVRLEWHMILLLREIVLITSVNKALNSDTAQTQPRLLINSVSGSWQHSAGAISILMA